MPPGGSNQAPLKELLQDAQRLLVENLLDKLKEGIISHQEMSILQKMLRDHGLTIDPEGDAEEQRRVREKHAAGLPEFDD